MFTICTPMLKCSLPENRDLFFSVVYPQGWEQSLSHGRHSANISWMKEGRKWKFSKGSSWSHRVRLRIWDSKCALKRVITDSLEGTIFQLWSKKLNQRERCRITVCRRTRKDRKDKNGSNGGFVDCFRFSLWAIMLS